jgi:hypothetical protein
MIRLISLPLCLCGFLVLNSCKKDKEAIDTDKELYEMTKENNGFTWFKNSNTLLNKSSGSGHSNPFLKTRYNAIAASQLDSVGKIKTNANFPEGSLIVKELYDNASTLARYAILYKKTASTYADANGWVWGYINSDAMGLNQPQKKEPLVLVAIHKLIILTTC